LIKNGTESFFEYEKDGQIPLNILADLIGFDPEKGQLFWLPRPIHYFRDNNMHSAETIQKAWTTRFEGKPACMGVGRGGRRAGTLWGKRIEAARLMWALYYGDWPKGIIEYLDGDRLNISISNLVERDYSLSNHLRAKRRGLRDSRSIGIRRISQKSWEARITYNGQMFKLGLFRTKREAVEARNLASQKLYPQA
jgi:hypothetical protein